MSNEATSMTLSRPDIGSSEGHIISKPKQLGIKINNTSKEKDDLPMKVGKSQVREQDLDASCISRKSCRKSVLRKSQNMNRQNKLTIENIARFDRSIEFASRENSQETMKQISDRISKWEKHLVYDDRHYERINQHYDQI